MKRKFSKILGVGLAITVLASLLVMATPASASAIAWGEESTSKNLKAFTNNTLAPALTDIVALAVNGNTIYAAASGVAAATGNTTYKSTDGGTTWSSLYYTTDYPTTKVPKLVAVAPDDANTVVVVTTENKLYYSSNGGSSWSYLENTASPTINAVDISGGTTKYIAAAGATSAGAAELYVLKVAMAETWTARYSTANGARANQPSILAVRLSPNFTSDKIINVVSTSNGTDAGGVTAAYLQAFRNETGAFKWNSSITGFTDWGTGIQLTGAAAATGIHALTGTPAAADIAMVPTYRGGDSAERNVFIAVAGSTSGGGVTRFNDVYPTILTAYSGASVGAIGSLAYHSTKGYLLAGDYDTAQVYRFLTPMASGSDAKAQTLTSLKQPGGVNMTQVAWVGDNAAAATAGNESAFAVSTDNGKTYNDVSLIDTTWTTYNDFAVNAAGSKIYLSTKDAADSSIWVKGTTWQRILSQRGDTVKRLVRVAPENDAVVYVAATAAIGGDNAPMWVSKDSGTTWTYIPNYKLASIQDFVVQDANTVYAIDTAGISKTTDAGGSWGDKKTPTDSFNAYMITLADNSAGGKDVLIGGSDGYVAYSKDGGATLTRTQITVAGNVQVVADKDYATNNYIYAGVGTAVYRGKADSTSSFSARSPTIDTVSSTYSWTVTGLVRDGSVFYAVSSSNVSNVGALSQALNLTSTVASASLAQWSTVITTSYGFAATPQSLKLASGSVLWSLGTSSKLVAYTASLATGGPVLSAPSDNYTIPINATTGRAYNVSFTFNRPAGDTSGLTTYFQLQMATDSAFGGLVYDYTFTDIDETSETRIIGPNGVTNQVLEFMPDTTYYWRMRVAGGTGSTSPTLQSAWSETRKLNVAKTEAAQTNVTVTAPTVTVTTPPVTVTPAPAAVAVVPFGIVSPKTGETNVSITPILTWTAYEKAIGYEVALATDPTFAIIDYSHNVSKDNLFYASETLNYNTTYYWRVRGVTGPAPAKAAAPGGPWSTGAFTTMAEPAKVVAPQPTVIVQKEPPPPPEIKVVEVPVPQPQPIPSYLLWIIIIIGAVLIIALIVLIARTRRVA